MIPDANHPCWHRVLTSEAELSGAVLATKILISRLRREVNSSPAEMGAKIAELRVYFEKNAFAAKDIALL